MITATNLINSLENESYSHKKVSEYIQYLKKYCMDNNVRIDDFIMRLFEGDNSKRLQIYRNKNFVAGLLVCMIWERLHRGGIWSDKSEVCFVNIGPIEKLKVIINRVERILSADQEPLVIASKILINSVFRDYHAVGKLSARLSEIGYPKEAFMISYFVGAETFSMARIEDFDESSQSLNFDLSNISIKGKPAVLISCDIKYYEKFSYGFLKSGKRLNGNYIFVFLVVDGVENKCLSDGVYVCTLPDSQFLKKPALYASARFLVARSLIEHIGSRVFIFDIDFEFNDRIIDDLFLLEKLDFDIGLCFNRKYRALVPWSSIPAAVAVFENNVKSHFFLSVFYWYFSRVWTSERSNWWIDQNALFFAYKITRDAWPSAKFINLVKIRDLGATNGDPSVISFKKDNKTR